jgi:hypothetical protein
LQPESLDDNLQGAQKQAGRPKAVERILSFNRTLMPISHLAEAIKFHFEFIANISEN